MPKTTEVEGPSNPASNDINANCQDYERGNDHEQDAADNINNFDQSESSQKIETNSDVTNSKSSDHSPKVTSRKKKKKKRSYDTLTEEDLLPTHARKTQNGGYKHTNISKGKIGKANAGNTPWNKGKNRSSADRAKIAAGVRARNRAILLEKLKRLGMSEDEWDAKRREIKYLRERLRRAKLTKRKHDENEAEMKERQADAERKLKAAIEATTEKGEDLGADAALFAGDDYKFLSKEKSQEEEFFSKEVVFNEFSFAEGEREYKGVCPLGGPGGLICCEFCADKYSWFLSSTVKDMETSRVTRNATEVLELLTFLKQGRETLARAHGVAKKKVPPLPPNPTAPKVAQRSADSSKTPRVAPGLDPSEWNMTSTIDVAGANLHRPVTVPKRRRR